MVIKFRSSHGFVRSHLASDCLDGSYNSQIRKDACEYMIHVQNVQLYIHHHFPPAEFGLLFANVLLPLSSCASMTDSLGVSDGSDGIFLLIFIFSFSNFLLSSNYPKATLRSS